MARNQCKAETPENSPEKNHNPLLSHPIDLFKEKFSSPADCRGAPNA
jgi:hypothetical protein